MRENDQDKARYRDHDIVFIEASIVLLIVLAMIGKRQRGRRSKRPDYKLESAATRTMRVDARAGFIAGSS